MLQITLTLQVDSPEKLQKIASALRDYVNAEYPIPTGKQEIAALVVEQTPESAFGSPTGPLPLGATAAPCIAVASPLPTAPVVTTDSLTVPPVPPCPVPLPAAEVNAEQANATGANPARADNLDKHGLPWDGRIHSDSKSKVADGSWRKRRNVAPELVAAVETELRALMSAPAAPVPPVAVAVPPVPPVAVAVPPVPPVAVAVPPVPPVAHEFAATQEGYGAMIKFVSQSVIERRLTMQAVTSACESFGVPALASLSARLDLVPAIGAKIVASMGGE